MIVKIIIHFIIIAGSESGEGGPGEDLGIFNCKPEFRVPTLPTEDWSNDASQLVGDRLRKSCLGDGMPASDPGLEMIRMTTAQTEVP